MQLSTSSAREPVRFQDASRLVQAWRLRWYALIPFTAVKLWWIDQRSSDPWPFAAWWSTAIGIAHMRMNWVYEWGEDDDT